MLVSADQKRASNFQTALSLSDESKLVIIEMPPSHPRVWDFSMEHDHNGNSVRRSYISIARELGGGITGEPVNKFSTDSFYIWTHGDQMARSACPQLSACEDIVLPGKSKGVEMNHYGLAPVCGLV